MTFQPKPFYALTILGMLLLVSYFAGMWQSTDVFLFDVLNGSLSAEFSYYNQFWALMSVRYTDLIPLIFILLSFLTWQKEQRLKALTFFVSLLLLMLIVRECLDIYLEWKMFDRESPSLVMSQVIRLSLLFDFNLKDASATSFPGDHAAVLLTWMGYFIFSHKGKHFFWVLLIVVLFSLPRLIAGAHWASDVLVGGLSIALIALALGLFTPILNKPNQWLQKLTPRFVTKLFNQLP